MRAALRAVYPRVGGGTVCPATGHLELYGLSPRGRGNRHQECRDSRDIGVYPRVGGGTVMDTLSYLHNGGLSPRGRGNRLETR